MKRILTTMLILTMLLMTFSGCQNKEPIPTTELEIYNAINTTSKETLSYYATFNGTANMDVQYLDPEMQALNPFGEIWQNMAFDGDIEFRQVGDNFEMATTYNIDLNGLSMDMDFYYDGARIIINYPVLQKYIVMSLEDVFEIMQADGAFESQFGVNMDTEQLSKSAKTILLKLSEIAEDTLNTIITEDNLELIDFHDYIDGESIISSKTLKIEIDSDLMLNYIMALIDNFRSNEEFYNLVKDFVPDDAFTFESYQQLFDELNEESLFGNEEFLEFQDMLKNLNYIIYLGYDDDFVANFMNLEYQISMTDELEGVTINMDVLMNYVMKHRNEIRKVSIPVVNEENSMNLFEEIMNPQGMF